jgi:hypothetical protein
MQSGFSPHSSCAVNTENRNAVSGFLTVKAIENAAVSKFTKLYGGIKPVWWKATKFEELL